jgi:hypothetical protein
MPGPLPIQNRVTGILDLSSTQLSSQQFFICTFWECLTRYYLIIFTKKWPAAAFNCLKDSKLDEVGKLFLHLIRGEACFNYVTRLILSLISVTRGVPLIWLYYML